MNIKSFLLTSLLISLSTVAMAHERVVGKNLMTAACNGDAAAVSFWLSKIDNDPADNVNSRFGSEQTTILMRTVDALGNQIDENEQIVRAIGQEPGFGTLAKGSLHTGVGLGTLWMLYQLYNERVGGQSRFGQWCTNSSRSLNNNGDESYGEAAVRWLQHKAEDLNNSRDAKVALWLGACVMGAFIVTQGLKNLGAGVHGIGKKLMTAKKRKDTPVNFKKVIELLLNAGADKTIADKSGKTAYTMMQDITMDYLVAHKGVANDVYTELLQIEQLIKI